ncbi:MAG: zinc ABC transporter substrate-binding protein [Bacteroidetes bacterium]|jgi:zinc/manganese transport system substrate-binding protein|nr:zinc ABC transporter substrate-binding protein [Bacteroidota bacterium]MBT3750031.1 zinc ABC transporter substrate-binding protein [Bacteroidota bacterium]MBT4399811.1 zinc ABC transporter substrate-binding protein [Bacteroidota bacterium]MBT4410286.1 zinc ABC transporter substrate-binding protein [Bacteroidota bacterium]MBT5425977.1 zinc ABC transporter substrate-binding protein [Bacteroidota bacterium]
MINNKSFIIVLALLGMSFSNLEAQIKVVCSFSDYAGIVKEIGKDKVNVEYIGQGTQDPHFIPPKPSFAMMLKKADMWITTGMDLEVWSTTLLDKARNKKVMDGAAGFVSVSDGIRIIQKVEKADRTDGDVHLMGNPHINTGPMNWKNIADNITIGLIKVDPANSSFYQTNRDDFKNRVDIAMFGDELVSMFTGDALGKMLDNGTLMTFLENEYEGAKLIDKLGGWLKEALPLRGMRFIAYHKNWAYFAETFGMDIAGYIEPKPGIPPSAKHVQYMVSLIKDQDIKVMLVASYFEKKSPQMIEDKTGIKAVYLPLFVGGVEEASTNFKLVDFWIRETLKATK